MADAGEVTDDYEPPARIGFRETLRWFGSDLMEARPAYTLEADGDKTIVHHVAEGELFGVMRLIEPVAGLLASRRPVLAVAYGAMRIAPISVQLVKDVLRLLTGTG